MLRFAQVPPNPEDGTAVRKDANDGAALLEFLAQAFEQVGALHLAAMLCWDVVVGCRRR